MAEFLSDEWFAELATRLGSIEIAEGERELALGQVVTDGPHGEVSYTLHLGGSSPARVERGTDSASVVLVEDFETARHLASGGSGAELIFSGKVKIRGDVSALLASSELLARLGDALSSD